MINEFKNFMNFSKWFCSVFSKLIQKSSKIQASLAIFGAIILLRHSFNAIKFIYQWSIRPGFDLYQRYGGGYAVITGGTDGIRLAYCYELAKRGFNLLIISRSHKKLENKRNEIRNLFPNIDVQILAIDFSTESPEIISRDVKNSTKNLDVSLLVNNVGTVIFNEFEKHSKKEISDLININIISCTIMNWVLIPKMLRRSHKSWIISISSGSRSGRFPYTAIYAATKSYINTLSKVLSIEYENKIDIISFKTGLVTTKSEPIHHVLSASPSSLPFHNLKFLGHTNCTTGHWKHELTEILQKAFFTKSILMKYGSDFLKGSKENLKKIKAS